MIVIAILCISLSYAFDYDCGQTQIWRRQPRLYLNEREVLAPTAHGFSLIVDSTDQMVSKNILDFGTWEPHILTLIANIVKQGDTMLNLGSQTGLEAIIMGKMAGPKGKLFIFQPNSASYKIVVKNVEINELANMCEVYKLGAGKEKEILKLWIDEHNTGHSTFIKDDQVGTSFEQIEVDAVDNILQINLNFALLDVEKFEVEALLGMKHILERSSTIIAIIQWSYLSNEFRNEAQTKELLDWLAGEGFKWYRYKLTGNPCQLGIIEQIKSSELLQIREIDALLAGKDANLSRLLIK